jgi:hypothetical protein
MTSIKKSWRLETKQKGQGDMLQSVIILGFYPLKSIFANNFPKEKVSNISCSCHKPPQTKLA